MNKNIFFTSDLHIGHKNVIDFSNRPFKDLDHMHRVLINNYNSTVGSNDICYFLGDIGFGSGEVIKDVIQQLNGTKILIKGNHDKKGRQFWLSCGFSAVLHMASIVIQKEILTMTHCPIKGLPRENTKNMKGSTKEENWHGEEKHYKKGFSILNFGQFHLSGHIHSPNKGKSTKILHRQYDVGVDANKFRPVSISTIESWIAKTKQNEADFRDIPGFDSYKVNYYGQIKSFKRYKKGKIVSPYKDKDGYYCNSLRKNGKSKAIKVHRAVAKAFIPNPKNLPQVNHKNGLKFDNNPTNLEWCDNLYNQRHAWDNDLKTKKLTIEDIKIIKNRISSGESNTAIAKDYNVNPSTISCIKTGRCWNRKLDS